MASTPRGSPALLGALAFACLGCAEAEPASASAPARSAEVAEAHYVGRAVCAGCHPDEAGAFAGSHHDLAMAPADAGSLRGDFADAHIDDAPGAVRFFREGDGFFVEAPGRDGAAGIHEVAFAFGAEPLQQLLLPAPGGRLQAFGVAWDARPAAADGQRWYALFPDAPPDTPLHWTGFEQTANHQCLECHTTGFAKAYDPASNTYTSTWREEDVSCEACHGPASRHVAWAREGASADRGAKGLAFDYTGPGRWIFTDGAPIAHRTGPGAASRAEIDACARCHARRARFADDDRPDRPFLDAHRPALLDADLYHADGQPRGEVYVWGSFLQSRMAAAGVTCSDCHEPHSLALRVEGDALCGGCHRAEVYAAPAHHRHSPASPASRCVVCHMPETVVMGVDTRREHAFRVPRPDLGEALGAPDACTAACHSEGQAWAAKAIEGWHGPERPPSWRYPEALASARAVRPDAATRLVAVLDDPDEPAIARATAARELSAFLDPGTAASLERALRDGEALVRLAAVETAEALPPELRAGWLRPHLDDPVRAVRIAAARALAGVPLPPATAARLPRAVGEWREATRRNADRPEAHLDLALLATRLGDLDSARRAAERARAIDPASVPASVNLADVLRASGRDGEAQVALEDALARAPESPVLHYALGLLHVRQQRAEEAEASLARAHALAPDGSYAYALGLLLIDRDRGDEGLAVLSDALAQRPGDRQLLLALATLLRDRGERALAIAYARRLVEAAPGDPGAAALLASLER